MFSNTGLCIGGFNVDIYRLGSTIFKPLDLLEGWDSLIWTERYRDAGEFELKSYNVDEIISLLPCGDPTAKPSMVCLADSREAMIVESHLIEEDENGRRIVTTKGRSMESFLEQRVFAALSNAPLKMQRGYSDYGAVVVILWNYLVNTGINDVVFGNSNHESTDGIPNVSITDSTDVSLGNKTWWIEADYVYPKVLDFLSRSNLGIRCIRGNTLGPLQVVSVDSAGVITRTSTSNVTDLCVDIYNGHTRTKDQSTLAPVIFTEGQAHMVNSRYLMSLKNLKNVGYITSAALHGFLYWDSPDAGVTAGDSSTWVGLKKRVNYFDGGSKWGTGSPGLPGQTGYDNVVAAMTQKAELKVKRKRKTNWYDGDVSASNPYEYNSMYFLGDKVSFIGDYGISNNVRVLEYTRIQDSEGEREYPTLMFDGF